MDQTLEVNKVEILPNIKLWEPQRTYERRLGTIMAKDNRESITGLIIDVLLSHLSYQRMLPKRDERKRRQVQAKTRRMATKEVHTRFSLSVRRMTRSNPGGGLTCPRYVLRHLGPLVAILTRVFAHHSDACHQQDLIYKRDQAGITKASVTIAFDNSDRSKSPVGDEDLYLPPLKFGVGPIPHR